MFCLKCGRRLDAGARFCPGCGLRVSEAGQSFPNHRKELWEGSVHKCPCCGAPVGSFEVYCPACGNEIRDKEATQSVSELSERLDSIESERGKDGKRKGLIAKAIEQNTINDLDQRKINLILTFPIPNTVGDMLEFVILASSNVVPEAYSLWSPDISRKAVSDAWLSKCGQAMRKAEVSFPGDLLVDNMRAMLDDARKNVRRVKVKGACQLTAAIVGPLLLCTLLVVLALFPSPDRVADEIDRLEGITADIEQDLKDGEYYRALLNAESLDPATYLSDEEQRQWDVNREYWIDRVVNEAAENGIDLSDKASDLGTEEQDSEEDRGSEESQAGGFIDGLMNGVEHGLSEAQKNIDEFTRAISSVDNGTDVQ